MVKLGERMSCRTDPVMKFIDVSTGPRRIVGVAADVDDEMGNDPPMLGGGARLALAGALLDAGKVDEASKEIAEAMRLNGPSAWSHQGLARVAELRGARDDSQRQAALARAAWVDAEGVQLPGL